MKLKILKLESSIVYRLHHFFYQVCEKLAKKHTEIFEKAMKIIEEAEE